MSVFISSSLIHTQDPSPVFMRRQLSGTDMLSVFGLVTLNSNGHDVIIAIKESWSVFTFRSFAIGLVYF